MHIISPNVSHSSKKELYTTYVRLKPYSYQNLLFLYRLGKEDLEKSNLGFIPSPPNSKWSGFRNPFPDRDLDIDSGQRPIANQVKLYLKKVCDMFNTQQAPPNIF